jgi:hypothetical protein
MVAPLIVLPRLPSSPSPLSAVLGRRGAWPDQALTANRSVIPPVSWGQLTPLSMLQRGRLRLARAAVDPRVFFSSSLPPLPPTLGRLMAWLGRTLAALEFLQIALPVAGSPVVTLIGWGPLAPLRVLRR